MQFPAVNDTIVAVSTGWEPSPLGIVRVSGPESFALAAELGARPARPGPHAADVRLAIDNGRTVAAAALWFPQPRSYTGQDLVELHLPGCLPLLRQVCARLMARGARRAGPGEFTARAYLNGKLDAAQVMGVLAALEGHSAAEARQTARLSGPVQTEHLNAALTGATDLLARIEAGIDFVDEEDVRFITAAEVRAALEELGHLLDSTLAGTPPAGRVGRPHVALAGLPNAGKSSLFNALLGSERALVSPVQGTTRDVLTADVQLGTVTCVLQDCAGLGKSADDLDRATHLAAERTASQADIVLWVHAADVPWNHRETERCAALPPACRLLVVTKTDLCGTRAPALTDLSFVARAQVSVVTGHGLRELRSMLAEQLAHLAMPPTESESRDEVAHAREAVRRARRLVETPREQITSPELVALELREACERLRHEQPAPLDEQVLERIYTRFCVGK